MFEPIVMPKLVTGRGSIRFLATLNRKRVGVVCYSTDVLSKVESVMNPIGAVVKCIAVIEKEPYLEDIFRYQSELEKFKPDLIVSIGGGSVLDTAKALHLFYEYPDFNMAQETMITQIPTLGSKAVHVAIPTTSGTGSETTSAAVFIDKNTMTKKLFLNNNLIPQIAILDSDFTDNLPNSIAVMTGLDALTHAIEASTAKNASTFIQSLAVEAACDILENLNKSVDDNLPKTDRLLAKEKVHNAACMAGIAITNSCTGIVHSYDHAGPEFGLPHGLVCGIMLTAAIKITGIQPSYILLAQRLGLNGNPEELYFQFLQYIQNYIQKLGVCTSFKECSINQPQYFEKVNSWSENSLQAFATMMSPAEMTVEKGKQLYELAYFGVEI